MDKMLDAKHCPRDGAALNLHQRSSFGCHRCGECGGIFIEQDCLASSVGAAPVAPAADSQRLELDHLPTGDLECPSCSEPMHTLEHKGAEIDVCAECRAYWLDAGEWEQMAGQPPATGSRGRNVAALAAAGVMGAVALDAAAQPAVPQGGAGADFLGTVAGDLGEEVLGAVFSFLGEAVSSLF